MFIVLLFIFSSCSNWLDVQLDNKVDDSKLFNSAEGFKEALAGVYSNMSKQNLYGKSLSMQYLDVLAKYYNASNNTYQYWNEYNYEYSSTKSVISGFWNNLYSNISQLNCILMWADKNAGVMDENTRNQVRGEALALRAFLHFDLYRLFSPDVKRSPKADGIPYNKEYGISLPPMYSAEEVIQLVINDLKDAEECLANDPIQEVVPYIIASTWDGVADGSNESKGVSAYKDEADKYVARMNLYAVKAMLARAYQARGEFTTAVEKAKEVIYSGKFRLLEFSSIDQDERYVDLLFSDEHIFSLRNTQLYNYSASLHRNNVSGGVTTQTPLPMRDLASTYESNNDDARYARWFNLGNLIKFLPDTTSAFPQKMPVIKLSEMYLLIAECTVTNQPDTAMHYINMLRDHRIRNNAHWHTIGKDFIFEEMRREFVGEGQLWFAYKRNNRSIPGNSGETEPSDDIFVFPFPDTEIEDGHRTER